MFSSAVANSVRPAPRLHLLVSIDQNVVEILNATPSSSASEAKSSSLRIDETARLHRNHMRYRKTYKAQSDTWMMISLNDCLQQCLPSSADAAKRFPCQIKVPARLL